MSFRDAVKGISDEMLTMADKLGEKNPEIKVILALYSSQLKVALRASENEQRPTNHIPVQDHRYYIEEAKKEFKKNKNVEDGDTQVLSIANTEDCFTVPADMPVGARTKGPQGVLELRGDGQLHYV